MSIFVSLFLLFVGAHISCTKNTWLSHTSHNFSLILVVPPEIFECPKKKHENGRFQSLEIMKNKDGELLSIY